MERGSSAQTTGLVFIKGKSSSACVKGRAHQRELNEGAHLFCSKEKGSSERATGLVFIKSRSSSACVKGRARQ